jgi:hypothetical protein
MPEAYLTAGNGRIFYALKSYTLKQFDIFRREAFREMARGNWMKGIGNLLRLAIVVMICNGAADEIKDLLMNRKSDLSDVVIDQIANLAGFSRYTLDSMKREGPVQSVVKQIQPSFGFLTNLWKDIIAANKDPEENLRIDKLRSVKSIPLVGKFYYYWFGKGSNSKDSRHSTASPLERLKQEKSALEAKLKEAKKSKTQLNEEDLERLHVLRFYSGKISRCNKIIDNIKAMPQEEAAACFKTNQPKKAKDEEINLIKGEINEITNEALKAVQ